MGMMASQITNLTIVYSTVNSSTDQRKHQSSTSLAFMRGIHRWPVNSPHKWPVSRKMFPSDVILLHCYPDDAVCIPWKLPAAPPPPVTITGCFLLHYCVLARLMTHSGHYREHNDSLGATPAIWGHRTELCINGMMTSLYGNTFHNAGLLKWESTSHWWIPFTKGPALMFSLLSTGTSWWTNSQVACDLRRSCNVIFMLTL